MSDQAPSSRSARPFLRRLTRKNVLAGLMFIAIAALGLWLARDFPLGTLRRMSTGYMPTLLCWLLMGLGAIVLLQGLLEREPPPSTTSEVEMPAGGGFRESYGAVLLVAASLVAFALSIEPLGLFVAIALLVAIASFAYRGLKWWETLLTILVLIALSWAVFVAGLGMSVKVWPEFSAVIPGEASIASETRDPARESCAALDMERFVRALCWVPDLRSATPRSSGMTEI